MFFLSYKAENSTSVRMIAEFLQYQNIPVWFAEYQIPWSKWSTPKEVIDSGLRRAKFAICFTNESYIRSDYCVYEMSQLLTLLPENKIIEIAFPPSSNTHRVFPALSKVPYLDILVSHPYLGTLPLDYANRILEFISEYSGIPISHCDDYQEPFSKRLQIRSHGIQFSMDVAGWQVHHPNLLQWFKAWPDKIIGYEKSDENVKIWGHLIVGKQDTVRIPIGVGTVDDRSYYKDTLAFASSFFREKRHCWGGIHLMFKEGYGHPGFTTTRMDPMSLLIMEERTWARMYGIVLHNVEFAFFFFLQGSQEALFHYAYLMDRLVLSLQLEKKG